METNNKQQEETAKQIFDFNYSKDRDFNFCDSIPLRSREVILKSMEQYAELRLSAERKRIYGIISEEIESCILHQQIKCLENVREKLINEDGK